jgi:hypothetical protein
MVEEEFLRRVTSTFFHSLSLSLVFFRSFVYYYEIFFYFRHQFHHSPLLLLLVLSNCETVKCPDIRVMSNWLTDVSVESTRGRTTHFILFFARDTIDFYDTVHLREEKIDDAVNCWLYDNEDDDIDEEKNKNERFNRL